MKRCLRENPIGLPIFLFVVCLAFTVFAFELTAQTKPPLPPVSSAQPGVQVSLAWTYPTNTFTPDLTFYFFESTNAALPQPWPFFTSVSITNLVTTNLDATGTNALLSMPFFIQPGQYFFYCVPSNFWSQAVAPSNVAQTPPFVALPVIALNIRKGS
jgi:hypothetical protein